MTLKRICPICKKHHGDVGHEDQKGVTSVMCPRCAKRYEKLVEDLLLDEQQAKIVIRALERHLLQGGRDG